MYKTNSKFKQGFKQRNAFDLGTSENKIVVPKKRKKKNKKIKINFTQSPLSKIIKSLTTPRSSDSDGDK